MSPQKIEILLNELCGGLGFCLSPETNARLKKDPPTSVDDFAKAVFQAEGLDPAENVRLWRQVRNVVSKHFHAWDEEGGEISQTGPKSAERHDPYEVHAFFALDFRCDRCSRQLDYVPKGELASDDFCRELAQEARRQNWFARKSSRAAKCMSCFACALIVLDSKTRNWRRQNGEN